MKLQQVSVRIVQGSGDREVPPSVYSIPVRASTVIGRRNSRGDFKRGHAFVQGAMSAFDLSGSLLGSQVRKISRVARPEQSPLRRATMRYATRMDGVLTQLSDVSANIRHAERVR